MIQIESFVIRPVVLHQNGLGLGLASQFRHPNLYNPTVLRWSRQNTTLTGLCKYIYTPPLQRVSFLGMWPSGSLLQLLHMHSSCCYHFHQFRWRWNPLSQLFSHLLSCTVSVWRMVSKTILINARCTCIRIEAKEGVLMAFQRISRIWECLNWDAQFGEALQGERRTLQSESRAVDRERMGLDTHHNKLTNIAVLGTIQLASEVSCLPSEVSWLRTLRSRRPSIPTVAAPNVFFTALAKLSQSTYLKHRLHSAAENGVQFVTPAELWCHGWKKSTAQGGRQQKKGPATDLELGTYALSRTFSHELSVPVKILRPQLPFITGHGCAAIQRSLKTRASRLVLCAVWW